MKKNQNGKFDFKSLKQQAGSIGMRQTTAVQKTAIQLRTTSAEQYDAIQAAAFASSMSMSSFCLSAALRQAIEVLESQKH